MFKKILSIRKTSQNCWLDWFTASKFRFRYKQVMYPCWSWILINIIKTGINTRVDTGVNQFYQVTQCRKVKRTTAQEHFTIKKKWMTALVFSLKTIRCYDPVDAVTVTLLEDYQSKLAFTIRTQHSPFLIDMVMFQARLGALHLPFTIRIAVCCHCLTDILQVRLTCFQI